MYEVSTTLRVSRDFPSALTNRLERLFGQPHEADSERLGETPVLPNGERNQRDCVLHVILVSDTFRDRISDRQKHIVRQGPNEELSHPSESELREELSEDQATKALAARSVCHFGHPFEDVKLQVFVIQEQGICSELTV